MKNQNRIRIAAASVVLVALTAPAAALGHGSVYKDTARSVSTGDTPPIAEGDLVTSTRYVIANHGYSYVLREDNGKTTGGMIDYKRLPGAYRAQASVTTQNLIDQGGVGAQPHHTCSTPALDDVANIEAWQGESQAGKPEPFYGYVPFQEAGAGLEDDPALWIPLVQSLTGFDLTTVPDLLPDRSNYGAVRDALEAACEAIPADKGGPGVFLKADTINGAVNSLYSAALLDATNPLNESLAEKAAKIQSQQEEIDRLRAGAGGSGTENAALRAELAELRKQLKVALAGDLTATVTGPAGRAVWVNAYITKARAKAFGLKSTKIARAEVTLGESGTVSVTLKPSAKVAKLIAGSKRAVAVSVTAASGDRYATGKAVL